MKIYDKEAMFMVILDIAICALALWMILNRGAEIHTIVAFAYGGKSFIDNIKYVFSEEESRKRQKELAKKKTAYKNVFGKFAPLAPFSFFILLAIGLLLLKVMEGSALGAYVIICGLFAPTFVRIIVSDEMIRIDSEQK